MGTGRGGLGEFGYLGEILVGMLVGRIGGSALALERRSFTRFSPDLARYRSNGHAPESGGRLGWTCDKPSAVIRRRVHVLGALQVSRSEKAPTTQASHGAETGRALRRRILLVQWGSISIGCRSEAML